MEKKFSGDALHFQGQRVSLVAPSELLHLLELKAEHPSAPLTVGNTTIGKDTLTYLVIGNKAGEFSRLKLYVETSGETVQTASVHVNVSYAQTFGLRNELWSALHVQFQLIRYCSSFFSSYQGRKGF